MTHFQAICNDIVWETISLASSVTGNEALNAMQLAFIPSREGSSVRKPSDWSSFLLQCSKWLMQKCAGLKYRTFKA